MQKDQFTIIADDVDKCVTAALSDNWLAVADFYCTGRSGGEKFAAGYMPLEHAENIIRACVRAW